MRNILLTTVTALLLASCGVYKPYSRPEEVIEVRHRVRVALVHSVIETDKFLKFSLCGDFLDCNSHISYL